MPKRKLSGGEAEADANAAAKEHEKEEAPAEPEESEEGDDEPSGEEDFEDDVGQLEERDTHPLDFLIAPLGLSKFLEENWERKPLHLPANDERRELFGGLFSIDALTKLADQLEAAAMILMDQDPGEKGDALSLEDDINDAMVTELGPLQLGRDVVAARYRDGQRDDFPQDKYAAWGLDSSTIRAMHEMGYTLQLHQPQRYLNPLWRLLAALEGQLGCLVGCNAYVTPPKSQGLAPHHDDVELFVCQTQGTKRWKLYKPVDGFELPANCSEDLPQAELGKPILEVTLQPGDVLYVPRGVVHQAVAQDEGSCHLTISTYQRWSYGSLSGVVIEAAQEAKEEDYAFPLELRRGLPFGFVFNHGLLSCVKAESLEDADAAARPVTTKLAAGLRALAAKLEAHPSGFLAPAADKALAEFMGSRLPPHPSQLLSEGPSPTSGSDTIVCTNKNAFALIPQDKVESDDEEEDEEDEDEDEGYVKLVTTLRNNRYTHMVEEAEDDEEEEEEGDDDEGCEDPACGHPGHHHHGHDSEDESGSEDADMADAGKGEGGKKGKDGKPQAEPKADAGAGGEDAEKSEGGTEDPTDGMSSDEEGSEDEEEDDEEDEELPGPVFPASCAQALAQVLSSTPAQPLRIADLRLGPTATDETKVHFAAMLHEFGVVRTIKPSKAEPAPAAKAAEKVPKAAEPVKASPAGKAKGASKDKGASKGKAQAAAEAPQPAQSKEPEKDKAAGKGKGKEKGKEKDKAAPKEQAPPPAEPKPAPKGKAAGKGKAEEEPAAKKAKKGK